MPTGIKVNNYICDDVATNFSHTTITTWSAFSAVLFELNVGVGNLMINHMNNHFLNIHD